MLLPTLFSSGIVCFCVFISLLLSFLLVMYETCGISLILIWAIFFVICAFLLTEFGIFIIAGCLFYLICVSLYAPACCIFGWCVLYPSLALLLIVSTIFFICSFLIITIFTSIFIITSLPFVPFSFCPDIILIICNILIGIIFLIFLMCIIIYTIIQILLSMSYICGIFGCLFTLYVIEGNSIFFLLISVLSFLILRILIFITILISFIIGIISIILCSFSTIICFSPILLPAFCLLIIAFCILLIFIICESPCIFILFICLLQIIGCLSAPFLIIFTIGIFCFQIISIPFCCCCCSLSIICIIVADAVIAIFFGMCIFITISPLLIFPIVCRIILLTFPTVLNLWRNLPLRLTYPEITYLIERYCRLIMFRISQMNVFFAPFSIIENLMWNLMRKKFG